MAAFGAEPDGHLPQLAKVANGQEQYFRSLSIQAIQQQVFGI
jgi:hypothetical protein